MQKHIKGRGKGFISGIYLYPGPADSERSWKCEPPWTKLLA